jgi:hypothetical protein
VLDESHPMKAIRYPEQNPVRAKMGLIPPNKLKFGMAINSTSPELKK